MIRSLLTLALLLLTCLPAQGQPEQRVDTLGAATYEQALFIWLQVERDARKQGPSPMPVLYPPETPATPWDAWSALQLTRDSWSRGERLKALASARDSVASASHAWSRVEARSLLDSFLAWDRVNSSAIGVLLPLTGVYKRIGEAAKRSVELAFQDAPGISLVFRDTAGDPERARREAVSLVSTDGVIALLGPVGLAETRAVVAVARERHVPHLHLSSAREFDRRHVWRFRSSQAEQGRQIALYATKVLGLRRLAVLFPESRAGVEAMEAFWETALAEGAEIRAAESFPKHEKEFSKVVARLLAATKPGRVRVDFEALFIPTSSAVVRRLVPFLKFWGLRFKLDPATQGSHRRPLVQLLGASGWHHSTLVDRGENLTDNAVFVTPFYHDPNDPVADDFATRFHQGFGQQPTGFHAEVYDAARLLRSTLQGGEGTDHQARLDLVERFRGLGPQRGVTGLYRVTDTGLVERIPRLMTVDMDELRPRLPEAEEAVMRRKGRGLPATR